jgi:hypothetical protein
MIEEFRRAFGERYRDLRVGEWQKIGPSADDRMAPAMRDERAAATV